jgi:hypothetical protein
VKNNMHTIDPASLSRYGLVYPSIRKKVFIKAAIHD